MAALACGAPRGAETTILGCSGREKLRRGETYPPGTTLRVVLPTSHFTSHFKLPTSLHTSLHELWPGGSMAALACGAPRGAETTILGCSGREKLRRGETYPPGTTLRGALASALPILGCSGREKLRRGETSEHFTSLPTSHFPLHYMNHGLAVLWPHWRAALPGVPKPPFWVVAGGKSSEGAKHTRPEQRSGWSFPLLHTSHFTSHFPLPKLAHFPHFPFWVVHFPLHTSHFPLHTFTLQTYPPHFTLPLHTSHFKLPTSHFPLHTSFPARLARARSRTRRISSSEKTPLTPETAASFIPCLSPMR